MEDWNKDFRNIKYPSVELFITAGNVDNSELNVVLCQSVDKYPKYVIQFQKYLAFRSHPETGNEAIYDSTETPFKGTNSIALDKSAWLNQVAVARDIYGHNKNWTHFIFLGGDNIVEIISDSKPIIVQINQKTTFKYLA